MKSKAAAETASGETHTKTMPRPLLSREKITAETLQKCKDYAEQALAWLVKESVADKVEVAVERNGLDRVDLSVQIFRDNENIRLQFADVWKGLKNGI